MINHPRVGVHASKMPQLLVNYLIHQKYMVTNNYAHNKFILRIAVSTISMTRPPPFKKKKKKEKEKRKDHLLSPNISNQFTLSN